MNVLIDLRCLMTSSKISLKKSEVKKFVKNPFHLQSRSPTIGGLVEV